MVFITSAKRRGWPAVQAYNQQDLFEDRQQTDVEWYERPELSAADKEKRLREAEKYIRFNKKSSESRGRGYGSGRVRRRNFRPSGFSRYTGARRHNYRDESFNNFGGYVNPSMMSGGQMFSHNNYVPPMFSLPPPAPRGGGSVICYFCKSEGHKANMCPAKNNK